MSILFSQLSFEICFTAAKVIVFLYLSLAVNELDVDDIISFNDDDMEKF